ncbi:MAG: hypothetical protein IAI48_00400 [Candidatus Eremiobacteraeota bacterium]|nr:hypothetical protein [Candidatus Eremiobacteraeota bacterium]
MSVVFNGGFQLRDPYFGQQSRYRRRGQQGPSAGAVDLTVTPSFTGIAAPAAPTLAASTTGGTLAAGTYTYAVTAYNVNGETIASTTAAATTTGTTGSVGVTVTAVTGATGYRLYGRVAGSLGLLADMGASLTYVDTGAIVPGAVSPTVNGTQVITGAVPGLIRAGDFLYRTASGLLAAMYGPANSANCVGVSEANYPERLGIDNLTTIGRAQYDTNPVALPFRTSGEFAFKTTPGDSYTPGRLVYIGADPQTVTVVSSGNGSSVGQVCNDQNPTYGGYSQTVIGAAGVEVTIEILPAAAVV